MNASRLQYEVKSCSASDLKILTCLFLLLILPQKPLPDISLIRDLLDFPFNLNDIVSIDPVAYQGLPNKETFTPAQREMIRVLRNRVRH